MKRAVLLMLLAVGIAGALVALEMTDARGGRLEKVVVGPGASGTRQSMGFGDVLMTRLPSSPSTGFAWQVRADTQPVLVLVARKYRPPTGQLVGAPGTAVLRFRAAAAGRTVVRLAYVRSWETGVKLARTFTLRVTVAR
jgi:inhibitor of cysteine peptidase